MGTIRSIRLSGIVLTLLAAIHLPAKERAQEAEAATPKADPEAVLFAPLPAIETAALYSQTLHDAPSSVTVITDREIRRFGYRTLAEALSSVRGFYFTSDSVVQFAGVRGFGLPEDFNSRILVMVNGHFLTDNVYGAMYLFGHDFGVDLDLVQRIEVVRGPSSALYGSNGVFATINIITRAPADSAPFSLSTEFGSFGEQKAVATGSMYFGRGSNLLLSASTFRSSGRQVVASSFRDFPGGTTDRVSADQGYHTFAQFTIKHWSIVANFGGRRVSAPIGWYESRFGDPGTSSRDAHNFIEAMWQREISGGAMLRLRFSYDQYRYRGRYDYGEDQEVTDLRDDALGDWLTTQISLRKPIRNWGALTVGVQASTDIRNRQREYNARAPGAPEFDISEPNARYGVFAQQEWNLTRRSTIYLGARFDDSRADSPFVSPRAAWIFKPNESTAYKFMYGRAFRDPSTYERFYDPNPGLNAETMNTFEVVAERSLGRRMDLVATAFHYRLSGLIELASGQAGQFRYENVSASRSTGGEIELQMRPGGPLEIAASFTGQRSRYLEPSRGLANSPAEMAKLRAGLPLFRNRCSLAYAIQYLSARESMVGAGLPAFFLSDITATTNHLHRDFDIQFGVRNLADAHYNDPMSGEHLISALPRAGRTMFVKLLWAFGE